MILHGDSSILEIERALLATMMLSPGDCSGLKLREDAFCSEFHRDLFKEIESLSGASRPVDPLTVADHFQMHGKKALGDLAMEIGSGAMTTAVPDAFARRIMGAWRTRMAQDIGRVLSQAREAEAIDIAISALMDLNAVESKHEWTAKEAATEAFKKITAIYAAGGALPGVTAGLDELDAVLGGFHVGDLVIVGGRAAMGKTAFLGKLARAAAAKGVVCGFISGEQPVEQIAMRSFSAIGRIEASKFRTAQFEESEWGKLTGAIADFSAMPIHFLDQSNPHIAEVARWARRMVHKNGMRVLYIDYLQRIKGGEGDKKHERIGDIALKLKNLARDLGITVVALAQLSRDVEKLKDAIPQISHLADSSEIEKEADVILLLYRAGYYDTNAPQDEARIIIGKNRHGPTGFVDVFWQGAYMDFSNASDKYGTGGDW